METNKNSHCTFCNSLLSTSRTHSIAVVRNVEGYGIRLRTEKIIVELPVCKNCNKKLSPFIHYNKIIALVLYVLAFICVLIGIFQKELFTHSPIGATFIIIFTPIVLAVSLLLLGIGTIEIDSSFTLPLNNENYNKVDAVKFIMDNGFVLENEPPKTFNFKYDKVTPIAIVKKMLVEKYHVEVREINIK